jgi:hypothetical protein
MGIKRKIIKDYLCKFFSSVKKMIKRIANLYNSNRNIYIIIGTEDNKCLNQKKELNCKSFNNSNITIKKIEGLKLITNVEGEY